MSQSVTYVGPYPDVLVWLDDEKFVVMEPGGVYDVPDAVAANLLEQGAVVHASASGSGEPPQSATKDEWAAYRTAQGHLVEGLTKAALIELPDTPVELEA